jgi:hypothetical protein
MEFPSSSFKKAANEGIGDQKQFPSDVQDEGMARRITRWTPIQRML